MPVINRSAPSSEVKLRRDIDDSGSFRASFYREELEKHWRCLGQQRESFSEGAFAGFEMAYERLLFRINGTARQRVDERDLSEILRSIDVVTRLSIEAKRRPTN